jgi:predicted metal-dependent enzyme (double-stranded beta helix superfamily)
MRVGRNIFVSLSALVAVGGLATQISVSAQDVPPHYKASPDVYKLVSENDKFRVIEATWKPGMRDAWHSHSGAETAYRLTDCQSRIHTPDGKSQDRTGKAGEVNFNPIIVSHSFENVGPAECKALIVERK